MMIVTITRMRVVTVMTTKLHMIMMLIVVTVMMIMLAMGVELFLAFLCLFWPFFLVPGGQWICAFPCLSGSYEKLQFTKKNTVGSRQKHFLPIARAIASEWLRKQHKEVRRKHIII